MGPNFYSWHNCQQGWHAIHAAKLCHFVHPKPEHIYALRLLRLLSATATQLELPTEEVLSIFIHCRLHHVLEPAQIAHAPASLFCCQRSRVLKRAELQSWYCSRACGGLPCVADLALVSVFMGDLVPPHIIPDMAWVCINTTPQACVHFCTPLEPVNQTKVSLFLTCSMCKPSKGVTAPGIQHVDSVLGLLHVGQDAQIKQAQTFACT